MAITITQFADKCETLIELTNSCCNSIVVDWTLAPNWADWWAMDYNGECYWYEQKPSTVSGFFYTTGADRTRINSIVCPHESFFPYWRETLCERPGTRGWVSPDITLSTSETHVSFVISYDSNTLCFTDPLEFKRAVTWLNTREIKYTIS